MLRSPECQDKSGRGSETAALEPPSFTTTLALLSKALNPMQFQWSSSGLSMQIRLGADVGSPGEAFFVQEKTQQNKFTDGTVLMVAIVKKPQSSYLLCGEVLLSTM